MTNLRVLSAEAHAGSTLGCLTPFCTNDLMMTQRICDVDKVTIGYCLKSAFRQYRQSIKPSRVECPMIQSDIFSFGNPRGAHVPFWGFFSSVFLPAPGMTPKSETHPIATLRKERTWEWERSAFGESNVKPQRPASRRVSGITSSFALMNFLLGS